jgi:hypothetical protein
MHQSFVDFRTTQQASAPGAGRRDRHIVSNGALPRSGAVQGFLEKLIKYFERDGAQRLHQGEFGEISPKEL